MSASSPDCPVCREREVDFFLAVDGKSYYRCPRCAATFLEARRHPTLGEEKAHYAHHQNAIDDPGYRQFLSTLAGPLIGILPLNSSGLDYGCGPGPALGAMLEEAGHTMALFDPIFRNDERVLNEQYDFIVCTETAEHFHAPATEFQRMNTMLRPGGLLAVMTCFQTDDEKFAHWHYRADPTHVVFYREETFRVLANIYDWRIEIPCKDVVIATKKTSDGAGS